MVFPSGVGIRWRCGSSRLYEGGMGGLKIKESNLLPISKNKILNKYHIQNNIKISQSDKLLDSEKKNSQQVTIPKIPKY